jgi:hypothetical protein
MDERIMSYRRSFFSFEEILKQVSSLLEIFFQGSPAYLFACEDRHDREITTKIIVDKPSEDHF